MQSDYQTHELPPLLLVARKHVVQVQTVMKLQVAMDQKSVFGIDDIAGNDKLVTLYTGFPSYDILLAFLSS